MVAVFSNTLTSSLEVLTLDGFSKIRITRKKLFCVTCLCACVYRNLSRVVSSASESAFLSSTAHVIFSVGCQITPETKVFPVSQIIIRHHIHFLHPGRNSDCRRKRLTWSEALIHCQFFSSEVMQLSESWFVSGADKGYVLCGKADQRSKIIILH